MRVEAGEVEAVLRQQADVSDAVVAARQDALQNQSLIVYVVGRNGVWVDKGELRHFLRVRVPNYMIPSAFVMMDALPLNASGKVDRHALPAPEVVLRERDAASGEPHDVMERQLQAIWERALKVEPIGVTDDFFELGGHSLLAVELFAEMEKELGCKLPLTALFQAPTIEGLAAEIRAKEIRANGIRESGLPAKWSPLVPIQVGGDKPPFFCVHGLGGGVVDYARLARLLGPEQPFYGLQAYGMESGQTPDKEIGQMAARFIAAMREVQPKGPYALGGYSYGGTVAYEMARHWRCRGSGLRCWRCLIIRRQIPIIHGCA